MAAAFFVPMSLIVVAFLVLFIGVVLVLGWLTITGRVGSRARREALARHPLTTPQRVVAVIALVLYVAAPVVSANLDLEGYSMIAFAPAILVGLGVWAWWKRSELSKDA